MKPKMVAELDKLANIAGKYGKLAQGTLDDISAIKQSMENFRAYVPFLGVFTVGKSSLLNDWLGESLLPEAQGPTTALATELLPGPDSRMVIVQENGTEKTLASLPTDEEEANTPEASSGLYAYCTSPSENLGTVFPIVPVDMPGLNSGIKRHTEAIYRYANRGAAFFLVFMPEEGTLPAAMKAFLQELDLGDRPVWIVITKCDTAHQEKIADVTDAIISQLRALDIAPQGVLHCARGEGKTASLMQKALLSLDVAALNSSAHLEQALKAGLRLKNQISDLRDSKKLDTRELDKQIQVHNKAVQNLQEALAEEEKKLSKKLSNLPVTVGDEVLQALSDSIESLVTALENGKEVFATRLTGIVNKVVNDSIGATLEKDFGETIRNIAGTLDLKAGEDVDVEKLRAVLERINQTISGAAERAEAERRATAALGSVIKISTMVQKAGLYYKLPATVLAVTTSVVSPLIELIIIFLPDLLALFNSKEKIRERIAQELRRKVFPQVQSSVINEMQPLLPDLKSELATALRKEWTDRLEDEKAALEEARSGKERAQESSRKDMDAFDADLSEINDLLDAIRASVKTGTSAA